MTLLRKIYGNIAAMIIFRFVTSQFLIDYWKDLGVEDGIQVLQDLGLDEERLDLKIVSEKLNEEIWHGVEVLR